MNEDLPEGGHKSDADWLQAAFDRALRGDNGTTDDAAAPAVSPFAGAAESSDVSGEPAASEAAEAPEVPAFDPNATVPIEPWELPTAPEAEPEAEPASVTGVTPIEPIAAPESPAAAEHDLDPSLYYSGPIVVEAALAAEERDGLDILFNSTPVPAETVATEVITTAAATAAAAPPVRERAPRDPAAAARTRTILIAVASGLGVLVLAIAAFFGGAMMSNPAPTATPTPTETALPDSARPAGVWAWNQLVGGECVSPFESAWQPEYTVVDCANPHAAQLVYRGNLAVDEGIPTYPGDAEIITYVSYYCSSQGIVDYAAAGDLTDIVVSYSYASSQAEWDAGNTSYYCFVSRTGGDLTGSLAGAALTDGVINSMPTEDATN